MKVKGASREKRTGTSKLKPSWELAIADAEERIARLRRSIELFKQNIKYAVPFPVFKGKK